MNHEFYKGDISLDAHETGLYDSFELEPFTSRNLTLNKEQISYLLKRYTLKKYISQAAVASSVFSCLYESMGGKADTSPKEVAAFAYICFMRHNFQFNTIFEQVLNAIRIDNIFTYLENTNTVVPGMVVTALQGRTEPFIWSQLVERHDFVVDASSRMTEGEILSYMDDLQTKATEYIDSLKNTDNLLKRLDIDLSND